MKLHTASEVISLTRLLENESAELYEQLCGLGKHEEELRGFAGENRRNVIQVQQAYNNVISDALESGFAFDIEADDFSLTLPGVTLFRDAVKGAIELETTLIRLFSLAADQSQSLLPDVSREFSMIVRKRRARVDKLNQCLVPLSDIPS
jgi:hypothetical protein